MLGKEHALTCRAAALAVAVLLMVAAVSGCTPAATPTAPPTVQVSPTEVVAPTDLPLPPALPTDAPTAADQPLPNDTPATGEQPLPGDTPAAPAGKQIITSQAYGVTLQCPAGWQPAAAAEVRYEGPDGFLQLSLISGEGLSIAEVADNEAHHQLQPYGSAPTIEHREVPGRAARLITPSADQPADMHGQAALVVLMPEPLDLNDVTYNYLVLWADQAHIADIGASMTFLPRE